MLGVKLICVGKMKERYFLDAFEEYRKRLGAYCRFELEELPEQRLPQDPSPREIENALEREGAEILRSIPSGSAVAAMCVEGEQLSSPGLAKALEGFANSGKSRVCFIVGGSFGLSPAVKRAADLRLSMSKMTFPHHLARVMLAEQIYRAFSISSGGKYHK